MRSICLVAVLPWVAAVAAAGGCMSDSPAQSTLPGPGTEPTPDPVYISGVGQRGQSRVGDPASQPPPNYIYGPPGGAIDPASGYNPPAPYGQAYGPGPQGPGPQGPGDSYEDDAPQADAGGQIDPNGGAPADDGAVADASGDGNAMGNVSDAEIDAALASTGQWIQTDEYGAVWRPDPVEVGADFTPYESGGSWTETDAGWAFVADYGWGWLPFHYGRWAWFHDYWGWVPGHRWGPSWVEWRHGGGLTGWRPLQPGPPSPSMSTIGFMHHGPFSYVDHRSGEQHEAHWRFAANTDFARPHIRSHLSNNLAENLRVTHQGARPDVHARTIVHANDIMRARFDNRGRDREWSTAGRGGTNPGYRPSAGDAPAARSYAPSSRGTAAATPGTGGYYAPARSYAPTHMPSPSAPIRSSAPVWSSPRPSAPTFTPSSGFPSRSSGGYSAPTGGAHPGGPAGSPSGGAHSAGGAGAGGGGFHPSAPPSGGHK